MNEGLLAPNRERDRRPIRFLTFGIVMILVFSGLGARLAYLQIQTGQVYAARAEANRTITESIPSPRGLIYDRKGRLLVTNIATWAVKIIPADLPFSRRADVAQRLGTLLKMEPATILSTLDSAPGSRFDPVRVADDVPEKIARIVSESGDDLPGVQVNVETRREYPDGPLLAHILGYTGSIDGGTYDRLKSKGYLADDLIGKAGVESSFESQLRGTYGQELVERDATGRDVQVLRTTQQAVPGASLTLTIDRTIQKEATAALKWGMRTAGLKRGVFIVMNPQTGEVLAMVSLPSYDNNLFARGISAKDFKALITNKNEPLTNQAVQGNFPPGSTFKLVTGTGGLADKKITPTTLIQTRGYLTLGGTRFYDWNHRGFGLCNINCGMGNSSDTFFYQVAGMLGADRLAYWARQYGFGAPTGIDLPGEVSGHRAQQQVEDERVRPADVRGRDLPGRDRPGLRRGDPDPAHRRVRGPRERRQGVPPAGRARGGRAGRQGRPGVQAGPHPQAPGLAGDAARHAHRRAPHRHACATRTTSWTCP